MEKAKTQDITFWVLAVIIAFLLWMYVTSKDNPIQNYDVVNVPVKIVNVDTLSKLGFKLMEAQDTIKLTIRGRRRDVLAVKNTDFVVQADLSGYKVSGKNSVLATVLEHPKNVEVIPQPTYIEIELDELVQKSFPIKVKTEIKVKDDYIITSAVDSSPKEVILSGALRDISSVDSVVASYRADDIAGDVATSLPLQILDKNGNKVEGVEASPNKVDISVDVQKKKKVPVNLRLTGNLPSGVYMKADPYVTPREITIVGEEEVINAINQINTEFVSLDDVTASVTKVASLHLDGVRTYDGSTSVSVDISVEGTISKAFNIPVNPVNLGSELTADLLTNTISVTLSGRESEINKLIAADITAVVDLTGAEEGEHEYTPTITIPEGFEKREWNPQKIKVIISKKQG